MTHAEQLVKALADFASMNEKDRLAFEREIIAAVDDTLDVGFAAHRLNEIFTAEFG